MKKFLLISALVGCSSLTRGDDQQVVPPDTQIVVVEPDASVSILVDAELPPPPPPVDASVPDVDAGSCTPRCDCDNDCSHGNVCRSHQCESRCDCDHDCGNGHCRYGGCED